MTIRDGISNSNHFWPFYITNKFFKVGSKALKCQHTINGEKFSHEVISPLEKEEKTQHHFIAFWVKKSSEKSNGEMEAKIGIWWVWLSPKVWWTPIKILLLTLL